MKRNKLSIYAFCSVLLLNACNQVNYPRVSITADSIAYNEQNATLPLKIALNNKNDSKINYEVGSSIVVYVNGSDVKTSNLPFVESSQIIATLYLDSDEKYMYKDVYFLGFFIERDFTNCYEEITIDREIMDKYVNKYMIFETLILHEGESPCYGMSQPFDSIINFFVE